ncbi:hypothetical protein C8R44DRAFT_877673 [Mycena epipterygia]|nr:hypothetical protein C8R44DRAFT_877673 [Mycena epipterygia]
MTEHRIRGARTGGVVDAPPSASSQSPHGYIDAPLSPRSLQYIRLWSDAPPRASDVYRSHPILPLEIIQSPGASDSSAMFTCTGCRRSLSRPSFPFISPKNQIQCFVAIRVKDFDLYDDRDDFDLFGRL